MKSSILMVILAIPVCLLAQQKTNLGISSFQLNSEINEREIKALEDEIFEVFEASEKFNILDRSRPVEELKAELEQLKEESNLDNPSASQPGQAQGAVFLLVGEFNGFGKVDDYTNEREDRRTGVTVITRVLSVGMEFSLSMIDVATGELVLVKSYNSSGFYRFSPGQPEFIAPAQGFEKRLREKAIANASYYAKKFLDEFAKPQLVLSKVTKGNDEKVRKFQMEGDADVWGALRMDVYVLEAYEIDGKTEYRKAIIGEAKAKKRLYPGLRAGKMVKGKKAVRKALNNNQEVYFRENNRSRNLLVGFFLLPLRIFGPLSTPDD